MSEVEVEVGQVFERLGGTLTAEVLRVEGDQAICRLRRQPSGRAFTGERPVPLDLLASDVFTKVGEL